jgi:FMN phosphatase YigB (HAD superfamily)
MIDTIMFDLDGTLLQFSQDDFIAAYFPLLCECVFVRLGLDTEQAMKAVWAGTKAMAQNDGTQPNARRFWAAFASVMGLDERQTRDVEHATDAFYAGEFDAVRSILSPNELPARMVRSLAARGYDVILATNPLFPLCAVETRLRWAGLRGDDFSLVTSYSNSTYCKPNPGYFCEIFTARGKRPERCLMAGNSAYEDMSAGALGAATFLVTDFLEEAPGGAPVPPPGRAGTLTELSDYLDTLPSL